MSNPEIAWLDYLKIPEKFRHKSIRINGRLFKPDAIDEINFIIWEFYGDYWHGNPLKKDMNKLHSIINKTYGEIIKKL